MSQLVLHLSKHIPKIAFGKCNIIFLNIWERFKYQKFNVELSDSTLGSFLLTFPEMGHQSNQTHRSYTAADYREIITLSCDTEEQ